MEKIRALIVDDEPIARLGVRQYLESEPDVGVVGECGSGLEAVAAILSQRPDLVFLDVQMPELDGFGVIEAVGADRMPCVIFVTAYDRYTLRAFEVQALDYLLKPFERERFRGTVERARHHIQNRQVNQLNRRLLSLLEGLQGRPRFLERVVIKSSGRIFFLDVNEIDWIEAADNYVRLRVGGRAHLLHETLSGLEQKLDPAKFIRIHRSRMVNVNGIAELHPLFHGEFTIVLKDGTELTTGRSFSERLRELLENRVGGAGISPGA
ncbi:MAG: LytR/AlgR family response regulator transcription factor [Blastocatellia bacterium]